MISMEINSLFLAYKCFDFHILPKRESLILSGRNFTSLHKIEKENPTFCHPNLRAQASFFFMKYIFSFFKDIE